MFKAHSTIVERINTSYVGVVSYENKN